MILLLGIVLSLFFIWMPAYFVTTDGAVHLHNTNILKQIILGDKIFKDFYTLNIHPNANWLVHLLLTGLSTFLSGPATEKVFLTLYVLIYISGFYKLIRLLKVNIIWSPFALVFMFPLTLFTGFYSFSLGIALLPYTLCITLYWKNVQNVKSAIGYVFIFFLSYLAHPMSYMISLLLSIGLWIMNEDGTLIVKRKGQTLIMVVQGLLIMNILYFAGLQQGGGFKLYNNWKNVLDNFIPFTSFILNTTSEKWVGIAFGTLISTIFLIILLRRIWVTKSRHKADVFFLSLLFLGLMYWLFPDSFLFQLMERRLQIFMYLIIYLILMLSIRKDKYVIVLMLIGFIFFSGLCISRIPPAIERGKLLQKFISFLQDIPPQSIVLGINKNHHQLSIQNKTESQSIPFFLHAHHYGYIENQVVVLDNYEAHVGWFPLVYKPKMDPYILLNQEGSLESGNNNLDIRKYEGDSRQKVQFIVMSGIKSISELKETYPILLNDFQIWKYESNHGWIILEQKEKFD